MSDDLVKRARDCANGIGSFKSNQGDFGLLDDLADRIEALEAALAKADELAEAVADNAWRTDREKETLTAYRAAREATR